jgi:glycosyltransferase involved in cell wall biosynthesis
MTMAHTVVHFLDSDTMGGCEQVLLSLVAGLDRVQWRPIVFHRESTGIAPLLNHLKRLDVPCFSFPPMSRHNVLPGLRRFASELRRVAPDVFHAHLNWSLACRHELIAARFLRVPAIVATVHMCSALDDVRFRRLKQVFQVHSIDRYIAVSEDVKDWLCQNMHLPESKVRVVKNGVSPRTIDNQPTAAIPVSVIAEVKRPIVLTTARLHAQKGINYLLAAAKLVPEAFFLIAGDGPDRADLQRHAKRIGVEEQVQFLGYREDIPQLLTSCDLFVLPSVYEPLGLSVLEAMAAGKPVIASAVGGLKESVIDGVTGLLVPPKNPERLAGAIRQLLCDRVLAKRFGEAGKARATQVFTAEAMVKGVTEVYTDLLAGELPAEMSQASIERLETPTRI